MDTSTSIYQLRSEDED